MTQTTSYSSQKLFLSLYKNALRRISGISFLYAILCFISFPVPYISEISNQVKYGYFSSLNGVARIYTVMSVFFYFIFVIGGAIIISVVSNGFMHNKRAVDVFHALPVKRHQHLLANFTAAITTLLLTQLICYTTVAVFGKMMIDHPLMPVFIEFLRVALLTVLIVSITFFCCVCCATTLDSAIFSVGFMAIVPAYTFLLVVLSQTYSYGFGNAERIILKTFKFSPAVMMYQTFAPEQVTFSTILTIVYVVATIAILAFACYIYAKRKSEMAQSVATKNLLYKFIIMATSVGGGILFGYVYHNIFGAFNTEKETVNSILLPSCLFVVVIFLVFNAILSRSVSINKKFIINAVITVVIAVVFIFGSNAVFKSQEEYVPEAKDVESVNVGYVGIYGSILSFDDLDIEYNDENKSAFFYNISSNNSNIQSSYNNEVKLKEENSISLVTEIHKTMVDEKDNLDIQKSYMDITFEYKLKNGKTVSRVYYQSLSSNVAKKLLELEDTNEFKTALYPVLHESVEEVESFNIKDSFGRNNQEIKLDDAGKELLYNAIAQDTLNYTSQMRCQQKGNILAQIKVNYKSVFDKKNKQTFEKYENVIFNVTESNINTIKALQELGLEQYTTINIPEDVKAVVGVSHDIYMSKSLYTPLGQYYYDEYYMMKDMMDVQTIIYEDLEMIKEISENTSSMLYRPSINGIYFSVVFIPTSYNSNENLTETMQYVMSYENAPEFVKRDVEKKYGITG